MKKLLLEVYNNTTESTVEFFEASELLDAVYSARRLNDYEEDTYTIELHEEINGDLFTINTYELSDFSNIKNDITEWESGLVRKDI